MSKLQFKEEDVKSELFYEHDVKQFEKAIKKFLNSKQKDELALTASVRTVGDTIRKLLLPEILNIFKEVGTNFKYPESRKKSAGVEFEDKNGMQYYIDIITHNINTKFNMPNITSVDLLQKLYYENHNIFVIIVIDYNAKLNKNYITDVQMAPIEFYDWECLTFGALGAGQIQIKNSSEILIQTCSRRKWMLEFCDRLEDFYINEYGKLGKRLEITKKTLKDWRDRDDIWEE